MPLSSYDGTVRDADNAQEALQTFGGNVEDSAADDRTVALAVCLAADALCLRLAQVAEAIVKASP